MKAYLLYPSAAIGYSFNEGLKLKITDTLSPVISGANRQYEAQKYPKIYFLLSPYLKNC